MVKLKCLARTAWNTIKPSIKKFPEWVVTGVIFAIAASLLSSHIMSRIEEKQHIQNQLDSMSKLYIGCNKEWLDSKFGPPQFSGQKNDYMLYAYLNDYFLIQVALDESNATRAYMITALENDQAVKWTIKDSTFQYPINNRSLDLCLGQFSYCDFSAHPEKILGFVGNGNARALYAEYYYFMSAGNYYNYYLASVDFGKTGKTIEGFLREFSMPEVSPYPYYDDRLNQIIEDRKTNCPNSYGVSDSSVDCTELFFTYDWFNSMQLRDQTHPSECLVTPRNEN